MNVLFLCSGADVAGYAYGMKQAFDRHAPGWSARAIRRLPGRFGYPADIEWPPKASVTPQVRELVAAADVLHVMDNPAILRSLDTTGKRIIVQHIGTRFRDDPVAMSTACRQFGALEVAGSFDLRLLAHLEYLPIVADLDECALLRRVHYRPGDTVRIAHAPTNRVFKSTILFLDVIQRLSERYPVELDIIEGVPWRECLARKARADILVDELTLGYGSNAVESWAMGVPVVSGVADPKIRSQMIAEFGELPFYEVSIASLETRLEALIRDRGLRAEWGARGLAHARRFHSEAVVVGRAIALYDKAPVAVAA